MLLLFRTNGLTRILKLISRPAVVSCIFCGLAALFGILVVCYTAPKKPGIALSGYNYSYPTKEKSRINECFEKYDTFSKKKTQFVLMSELIGSKHIIV